MILLSADHLAAQDAVVIRRADGRETKRTGKIVEWTGTRIQLENDSGRTRSIDVSDVKRIDTRWPEELLAARELVAKHDYAGAAASYQQASKSESRGWVKAIIGAELLQVFDLSENHRQAIVEFLKLYVADGSTRFFDLIPLAWSIEEQNIPSEVELKRWLTNDNAVLRLMSASWLLSRGNNQSAVAELEKLSTNGDKRIAQLALTQLWRTRLLAASEADVERWETQIQRLQPELRAGPLILLAAAQNRNGQSRAAQVNLLKARILHPQKKLLAAYALYLCGNIMSDSKQSDRAQSVWRELITNFPTSQYAALAGNKL